MSNKEIINDILISEKHLVYLYSTFLNEASNDTIYKEILSLVQENSEHKNRLFKIMLENNWYQLEAADQTKISQKYDQAQTELNQLQ